MYLYIYDEFIQDKRFEKDILQIENRLTDLGIAGKIARLALFRDPEEMIRDEIRRGATTVVAVGNDRTVRKILDVVSEGGATLAMIPLGTPDILAKLFGMPPGLAACDVLSARIVETVDLGTVNGRRFLLGFSIPSFKGSVHFAGSCRVSPLKTGALEILNLGPGSEGVPGRASADPTDGLLEALLRVKVPGGFLRRARVTTTVLPAPAFAVQDEEPMSGFADGEELRGKRFDVSVETGAIRVVTGRGRLFAPGAVAAE